MIKFSKVNLLKVRCILSFRIVFLISCKDSTAQYLLMGKLDQERLIQCLEMGLEKQVSEILMKAEKVLLDIRIWMPQQLILVQ
jgi:hypothetical protein